MPLLSNTAHIALTNYDGSIGQGHLWQPARPDALDAAAFANLAMHSAALTYS
jgi:hypothetical protein